MKRLILLPILLFASFSSISKEFDGNAFAQKYFSAMTQTQSPSATKSDLEDYVSRIDLTKIMIP